MNKQALIPSKEGSTLRKRCRACGTYPIEGRRRYCSDECRRQIQWVLSLSKGLLKAFNARYAAFSFNDEYVILDVLPIWSDDISRFLYERKVGRKPADDLKSLVLDAGVEWHRAINRQTSQSYATLILLKKNHDTQVPLSAVKPDERRRPRLSKNERESLKLLKIEMKELFSEENIPVIRSAYKKMAKIHHPDVGGDAEQFKKLHEAHQQMLIWAKNPQFTSRKALVDCWSYDGLRSRWSPPL